MDTTPPVSLKPGENLTANGAPAFFQPLVRLMDRQIPEELSTTPENLRRAKLITRFGILGALFGFSYATFYFLIDHLWGTFIILMCSCGVIFTPFLLRWKKSIELAGNFFSLTLTLGFFSLCFVEGGVHGHAIAWLVSVPLCSLLIMGRKPSLWWSAISFGAASVIVGLDLAGKELPTTYNPRWNSIVSAAGYLGLIVFLFILGLIFEFGRARASAKMEEALADLASSNERLVHMNNEKNEFLGIAAHDLKNPLTVILGNAELMCMTENPQLAKRCNDSIILAATRMRDLIRTLLDANAIEQGKFISNIERCDINEVVSQCVESNRGSADRKNILLRVGISDTLWAKADRAATMQVFDNLISNALKFSPPQTTIHVHTMPEKDFILVNVRDEGPGINPEDQKKMFQKFCRLTARPTGGESSNGLGLSIVKRLVDAMGGTIQCQSIPGLGATFMVRLPACPQPEKAAAANQSTVPPDNKSAITNPAAASVRS
jgi:signal transduction histidine kinase